MSALASRQLGEQVRQGNLRPEPSIRTLPIATGPAAAGAIDAHRIVRELSERRFTQTPSPSRILMSTSAITLMAPVAMSVHTIKMYHATGVTLD